AAPNGSAGPPPGPCAAAASPPPSPCGAAPAHRQSRSSAGSSSARNSGSGRGTSTAGMTARPHCFAASLATRCQRRARSRQRLGSRVTIVRSVVTGTTRTTPSSVAARTIASSVSPFGTDWTSVARSGDSASVRATPRTVPVTDSPTSSRRTVKSRPAPSAAITVSLALRRSTRARWGDSSRSKRPRPSWIRSGAIVKRRTDELEGGPTLCRDRRARSEAVAAERGLEADRLRVEDAAEQEGASGGDVAGVARRQPEVRGGQEIGHDERRRRLVERARVAEDTAHAIADPVAGRVRHRGGDGVGVVVDREDLTDAEPRGGDREHARAGPEVDQPARRRPGDQRLQPLEAPERARMLSGAEGAAGLDRDHEAPVRGRLVPGRRDQQAFADGQRPEVGAPGLRPVLARERDNARLAGLGKAERGEPGEVLADALLEGAGEGGLREEGAKPRSTAGRLLLDDAERSQLPDEVRQALGRLLGNLDGELPVAGGRHRLSRRASSCVRGTLAPVVRARPSTRPRRPAAPRAASR